MDQRSPTRSATRIELSSALIDLTSGALPPASTVPPLVVTRLKLNARRSSESGASNLACRWCFAPAHIRSLRKRHSAAGELLPNRVSTHPDSAGEGFH